MNRRILAALAFAAALGANAANGLPVYVKLAPPAPRVEVKVAAPGPGYVWTAGYYRWHGGAYVWVPGDGCFRRAPGPCGFPAIGRARRAAGTGSPATGAETARPAGIDRKPESREADLG